MVYDHGVLEGEVNKKAHLRISLENLHKDVRIIVSNFQGRVVAFEWEIKDANRPSGSD